MNAVPSASAVHTTQPEPDQAPSPAPIDSSVAPAHGPFDNVLQTIGRTPVVRLDRLSPPGVSVYAKLESRNPGGSVKDRMALQIIEAAERSGELRPGMTVFEASSGNTGIALAMVCARKGYPLVVTMAENFSLERRRLMRWLGAKVVLTPAAEKGSGMLRKATELAAQHKGFLCRQFDNPANPDAHRFGTVPEILADFEGRRLDAVVTGFGTGGTLLGLSSEIHRQRPGIRIVACEPDNAAMLASATPQQRAADGSPASSHPQFRPHPMQGWSPDFLSTLVEEARDAELIDELVQVTGEEAMRVARELAREEGILAGISSGATAAAALALARRSEPGSVILCLLPDSAERYLTSALFSSIPDAMDASEQALSASTPSARFDSPAAAAPSFQCQDPVELARIDECLEHWLGNGREPVLFALAWCEFGWALRRFLDAVGLRYRMVEVDGPELRDGQRTLALRQRLQEASGQATLPQLVMGGEWLGGCSDVFTRFRDGRLAAQVAALGLDWTADRSMDPNQFLPKWALSAKPVAAPGPR